MKAVIEVFRAGPDWHPYPWRFTVSHEGVTHQFAGIQNQCATKRQASIRARWRARWLEDGTFASRYLSTSLAANPQADQASDK